ncbi:MFS transporter [Micromonospora sp. WMMD812]|uniref:MFS transporter n=1 Tax=Micromonospora sp. WMMD812 TaxID=3015152 RepID=UPI00248BA40D|nr:MFS transporter [Micromonospora sp. WMMD812]WBB67951.1 MFS transporter [Micromonospora sp. WMMD812]
MTDDPSRTGGRTVPARAAGPVTLLGVLLLALNLRAAIAALAPLLPDVRADLHLGSGAAGLLTTLPVLCFGLLSPFAALLGRRIGVETALLAAMLGILAGSVLRATPGLWWVVAGTVVIGAGITVGNVLVPSVVKQDFPDRQGPVTALTTAALTGGAAVAAAVAAPLAHTGLGWRGALLLGGGLAAVAALAWLPQLRRRHVAPVLAVGRTSVLRSPVTWALAAFMGMQSLTYYALLAWLPTIVRDAGVSAAGAGWALGLFNLLGIATAVAAPALASRLRSQRGFGVLVAATWGAGLLGLLVAPSLYLLWATVTGLAQGAGIGLALALLVLRAGTPQGARDLSGTVQSVGYLVGSTGPLLVGVLRDRTGGWGLPLGALCVAAVVMATAALWAGRDRPV